MRWPWTPDRDDHLIADLAAFLGEPPQQVRRRTLATASGPRDGVVALREGLALRGAEVGEPASGWRVLQWPEVRSGSWDGETTTLRITTLEDERLAVRLTEPGLLPEVFVDRVQATLLVEERVKVPGGEVLVSGRRQPAGVGPSAEGPAIVWHAMAIGPADLNDPEVSRLVVAATERLRADYEL